MQLLISYLTEKKLLLICIFILFDLNGDHKRLNHAVSTSKVFLFSGSLKCNFPLGLLSLNFRPCLIEYVLFFKLRVLSTLPTNYNPVNEKLYK